MTPNTTKVCDVCGNEFQPTFNRKYRPQRYCSTPCRREAQRGRNRNYIRRSRKRRYLQIQSIHNESHQALRDTHQQDGDQFFDDKLNFGRIDHTHDTWDVIPHMGYERLGTVSPQSLKVVKDAKGNERIKAAIALEKWKEGYKQ